MVRSLLSLIRVGSGGWHWAKQTTYPAYEKGKNQERDKLS